MGLLERIKNLSDTDINRLLRSKHPEQALGKLVFELEDSQRRLRGALAELDRQARWVAGRIEEQDNQIRSCQEQQERTASQGNRKGARTSRTRVIQLRQARQRNEQKRRQVNQLADELRDELAKLRAFSQKVWARKTDLLRARQGSAFNKTSLTPAKEQGSGKDARRTQLLKQVADELDRLRKLAEGSNSGKEAPR